MPIYLIDKIQQKNNGTFKLVDASDINWDIDIPKEAIPDGEDGYYNKKETILAIQQAIANSGYLSRTIVDELPLVGEPNVIYMVKDDGSNGNIFDEYMWIESKWELLGTSEIDMTNYVTKNEANEKYAEKSELNNFATHDDLNGKISGYLPLSGGEMRGKISGIISPTEDDDVVNKEYVDILFNQITPENFLTIFDFKSGTENGTFSIKGNDISITGLGTAAYLNIEDIDSSPEWIEVI